MFRYLINRKWFKALYGEWFIDSNEYVIIEMSYGWELKVPKDKLRYK
jgi:hypothetical protein